MIEKKYKIDVKMRNSHKKQVTSIYQFGNIKFRK